LRNLRLLLLLIVIGACGAPPAVASAAPVVVLESSGKAVRTDDPFLTTPEAPFGSERSTAFAASGGRGVRPALRFLRARHKISGGAYRHYLDEFNAAVAALGRLSGTRAAELGAVVANLRAISAEREMTASRLPALFATLEGNRRWWTSGPLLADRQLVEFTGSELVWQYYAGQGIELEQLSSFGKADGLYTAGRYRRMRKLLDELIPLAAWRAGALTWEYYFNFDGGVPPWASAMSQGTALEALTRAFHAFGDHSYLRLAHRALPVLGAPPPSGVSVRTRRGRRFLLYSFAPDPSEAVLNGFLQTLIGLYDYAHASGDRTAERLFREGDTEARFEVPHYDTGSWSLYQPGVLDSVDYHNLVTGFLQELCDRVHAHVYCRTAARFRSYASHPPPGV
jgi:D-glucuronyl C5-epimerase C-terminus